MSIRKRTILKSLNHTIVTVGPHADDHFKNMNIPQMKIAISNSKILAEITFKKKEIGIKDHHRYRH